MSELQRIFETEARAMIHREGLEDALDFLHNSDFYTAPASTRFHGCHEGGLVEHSLSVYKWAFDILRGLDFTGAELEINTESLAIVTLFHDICKIGVYSVDYRNNKNESTGKWEKVPYYKMQDDSGYGGHGIKSALILAQYMPLHPEESIAIVHHMGAWDKSTYGDPGKAYEKFHLAWLLHVADEAASYIGKT